MAMCKRMRSRWDVDEWCCSRSSNEKWINEVVWGSWLFYMHFCWIIMWLVSRRKEESQRVAEVRRVWTEIWWWEEFTVNGLGTSTLTQSTILYIAFGSENNVGLNLAVQRQRNHALNILHLPHVVNNPPNAMCSGDAAFAFPTRLLFYLMCCFNLNTHSLE